MRWEHRVRERRIHLPNTQRDEAHKGNHDGPDNPGTIPGMNAITPIKGQKEQKAAGCEKNQADVVNLLDELPLCFVIILMLGLELRWVIEDVEHDSCDDFPGKTPPVAGAPADLCVGDENVPEEGRYGAEVVGEDHDACEMLVKDSQVISSMISSRWIWIVCEICKMDGRIDSLGDWGMV